MKKTPQETAVEMREMVMPHHTNAHSTIFGGQVMSWIDIAAAMTAQKHCQRPVVTVQIDSISFKAPIKIGYHVIIQAMVNYVGNTSMEIGVRVTSENPMTGDTRVTTRAYLTFVALDEFGKPIKVPELDPQTEDDKRRFQNAKKRVEARRALKAQLDSDD